MKRRSEGAATDQADQDWSAIEARIIGLGERSVRKTYYPQLKARIDELERFRGLLDQTQDVILMLDAQTWDVLDANQTARDRLGEGLPWPQVRLDALVPQEVLDHLKQSEGAYGETCFESCLGEGPSRFVAEIIYRRVFLGGDPYGVVVARDISKRKQYQDRLERKAAEEKTLGSILRLSLEPLGVDEFLGMALTALLGSIPWLKLLPKGGIFLAETDAMGREVLRLSAKHGLHQEIEKLCAHVPFGTCHCGRAALTREMQHSLRVDEQHEITHEGMEDHGHYTVPLIHRGRTLGVLVLYLPVGHEKSEEDSEFLAKVADALSNGIRVRRSETELSSSVDELAASQADLEHIAFIAAHDLQEPLRSIVSYAQLLEMKLGPMVEGDDDLTAQMGFMIDSAKRMGSLVHGLMEYTSLASHAQPFRPVALRPLVGDVLAGLSQEISKSGVSVDVQDLPTVHCDEAQVRMALAQLVANAITYRRKEGEPWIRIYGHTDGSTLDLVVADNGIGVERVYWSRIFEPFKRLHSIGDYPGTGIGLALARKVAERHGGALTVSSKPNEGSQFTLRLPL